MSKADTISGIVIPIICSLICIPHLFFIFRAFFYMPRFFKDMPKCESGLFVARVSTDPFITGLYVEHRRLYLGRRRAYVAARFMALHLGHRFPAALSIDWSVERLTSLIMTEGRCKCPFAKGD